MTDEDKNELTKILSKTFEPILKEFQTNIFNYMNEKFANVDDQYKKVREDIAKLDEKRSRDADRQERAELHFHMR